MRRRTGAPEDIHMPPVHRQDQIKISEILRRYFAGAQCAHIDPFISRHLDGAVIGRIANMITVRAGRIDNPPQPQRGHPRP